MGDSIRRLQVYRRLLVQNPTIRRPSTTLGLINPSTCHTIDHLTAQDSRRNYSAIDMSSQVAQAARRVNHDLRGIVVSAGLMQKTVKVRVGGQKWNKIVNKWFADPKHYMVHDPNSSLRTGDVVSIMPGWPTSQHKRHLIKKIIAPYGVPIEERPPIPSLEDLITERETKKAAKDERRAKRQEEAEKDREEKSRKFQERKEAKRLAQGGLRTEHKKTIVEKQL